MHNVLADLLEILSEEELIRFGRRAEMRGKLTLATLLKTQQIEREEREKLNLENGDPNSKL
jgi:hypothetical protein